MGRWFNVLVINYSLWTFKCVPALEDFVICLQVINAGDILHKVALGERTIVRPPYITYQSKQGPLHHLSIKTTRVVHVDGANCPLDPRDSF